MVDKNRILISRYREGKSISRFPRTLVQSYILDRLLKKYDSYIAKIFEIKVETLELIRWLDQRSKTDAAMPYDSSTGKIVKRLQEHEDKIVPVIEKYKERHDVTIIDGTPPLEIVLETISKEIENSFKNLK